MDHYPAPIYFVTISDQTASKSVLLKLTDCFGKLEEAEENPHRCSIFNSSDHLLNAFSTDIDTNLTVVLFDVPNQVKTYKPFHITQFDVQRPPWASSPQWSIKINTRHAASEKVIRNCTQQMAAWFRLNIKTAVPGQSYPWGPASVSERQDHILALAKQPHLS